MVTCVSRLHENINRHVINDFTTRLVYYNEELNERATENFKILPVLTCPDRLREAPRDATGTVHDKYNARRVVHALSFHQ